MKTLRILICTAALSGCATIVPAYDPVGSHTLRLGDYDADVVWIQKLNVQQKRTQLFRCHNSPTGPQCLEANTP